jgi:hypothetical protein
MSFPMPTSPIGEVQSYPKESLKAMAFQAIRRCRVTWADRYNWAKFFLYTTDAGLYPYFVAAGLPTKSNIIKLAIEPDETILTHGTVSTAQAVYTHAILTLVYKSAGYDDNSHVVVEEVKPNNQMQHVYAGNLYFGTNMPLGSTPSMFVPGFEYVLHYPRAKYVPGIVGYPGVINWDVYRMKMLPLWIYPFCGLYVGSSISGTFDYDGTTTLGVAHHVLVRNGNWNYEWSPYTGTWAPVFTKTGQAITKYAMTSFSGLF